MVDFEHAGARLKTARMAAGFKSAKKFCEMHDIPVSTYSLHESGGRNIQPKVAKKYADLLGVDATWLLTGTGTPYNTQEETISHEEYVQLLNYSGNDKIKKSLQHKDSYLTDVDPLLLCTITRRLVEILNESGCYYDDKQLKDKTVEIYQDIISTSKDQATQLSMVELAITTFRRQIQHRKGIDNGVISS